MTYAISSAEPSQLFLFHVKGLALDTSLVIHSGVLRATLQFFELTCREPGFRMPVSHSADWMAQYGHDAERVDDWVRNVGAGFVMADTAVGIAHVAVWAVGHIIDARNWVEDRVEEVGSAVVALRDMAEGVLAEAAKHILEMGALIVEKLPVIAGTAVIMIFFPKVVWIAAGIVAFTYVKSLALRLITPPQEFEPITIGGAITPVCTPPMTNECKEPFVPPRTAAEWFKRIEEVPEDEPIQIINLGNNQYMILIKGTKDWYGHSNIWPTNLYSGLGYESVYSERVRELIDQYIPKGHPPATLYIAGHSQGGHVAQLVANHYASTGEYAIGAMFSFGAYLVTQPHSGIKNAHAFLYANDPLNMIDSIYDQTFGQETILFDGGKLNPIDAHGDYESSPTLAGININYGPGITPTSDYASFGAPDEPPITDAVIDAVGWAGTHVNSPVETISDLSADVAGALSENLQYVSNEIVTDFQDAGDTLWDAGEAITNRMDSGGTL